MKIYKYKLDVLNSVKKITEYFVETTFVELFGYDTFSDEKIIRFCFNNEDDIYLVEKDDDILEAIESKLIKYEEVEMNIDVVRKIYELCVDNNLIKNYLYENKLRFSNIWKEIHK